jgi:hypothetical protein
MFPLYIEALFTALIGKKTTFSVTPKTGNASAGAAATQGLTMQKLALLCCLPVLLFGISRFIESGSLFTLFNLFWLAYSAVLLGMGIALIERENTLKPNPRRHRLPHLFGDRDAGWNRLAAGK